MLNKSLFISIIAFVLTVPGALAQDPGATDPASAKAPHDEAHAKRMEWFQEAKFGMFIHWGLYSQTEGEWDGKTNYGEWIMLSAKIDSAEYEKLAPKFNPVKFDAAEWARVAKDAGMKYMVITAKHHDGFAMYDSAVSEYDIIDATPFKRDPLKELAEACKENGLTFCTYYSIVDWHHPDFPAKHSQRGFHGNPNPDADLNKYNEYQIAQIKELMTNYGPIGLLWFDHGGSFKGEDRARLLDAPKLVSAIREAQPDIILNNRLGYAADYGTPEQHIPDTKQAEYFETCMTLNSKWGWNKTDDKWKEAPEVIQKLVDNVSKGGNFLLNVGPKPDGTFPEKAVEILKEVGDWMDVNGESIHGAQASPFEDIPEWGRITAKENKLYLHVFKAPETGEIKFQGLQKAPAKAWFLANQQAVETLSDGTTTTLRLPKELPDPANSVIALELD